MDKKALYSIGHGTRKIEDFLALLKKFEIKYLIDVRSQPFSKFNPDYNQNSLKDFMKNYGVTYVFMGDLLGGRPKDLDCYDSEGRVDYKKLQRKEFYLNGIKRLKTAYEKGVNAALMCSESKPCECHRSKLIGMTLFNDDEKIVLAHIDENGKLKDQASVMNELNKGKNPNTDLFNQDAFTTSRKNYL